MNNQRIYLSPPNISSDEKESVVSVLDSGWVAPVGPKLDTFEAALSHRFGGRSVVALNSGTSALHLALILAGVTDGDTVLVSSFTFAACANVVLYERAVPVFLDSEEQTWNVDPEVLDSYLRSSYTVPKALIVTHLYGMPAQMEKIKSLCDHYGISVIEDAAEALGSKVNGMQVGSFTDFGIVSFNGNKIVTTSGGGALICSEAAKERAIHLATQANSGKYGYDHLEAGFNYRMSNVLAGLGEEQLKRLDEFVARKRTIFRTYASALEEHFYFNEEPVSTTSNRWLTTCLLRNKDLKRQDLILYLEKHNIETRLLWKPLHLHPAYDSAEFVGAGICEDLFQMGICLPSGTGLTSEQQDFVISAIHEWMANQ